MDSKELLALAERAESIALNMASRAFRDPIQWDDVALADSANGFMVAASLRALATTQEK